MESKIYTYMTSALGYVIDGDEQTVKSKEDTLLLIRLRTFSELNKKSL